MCQWMSCPLWEPKCVDGVHFESPNVSMVFTFGSHHVLGVYYTNEIGLNIIWTSLIHLSSKNWHICALNGSFYLFFKTTGGVFISGVVGRSVCRSAFKNFRKTKKWGFVILVMWNIDFGVCNLFRQGETYL